MEYWFTADSHYSHGNIIKYCARPFLTEYDKNGLENEGTRVNGKYVAVNSFKHHNISDDSIELMNEKLIDQTNKNVKSNDILYYIGDFSMYFQGEKDYKYYERCENIIKRINCRNLHLVYGNHDYHIIQNLFSKTYHGISELKIRGLATIVLCHYALATWNQSHKGSIHLYGHTHSESESWLDRIMPNRRSMDVGVDNISKLFGEYRPVSLTEILDIMKVRSGHKHSV